RAPATSLSERGLLTIALAALVVVLLTIHRTAGPSRLARAAAEYTAVALLAALLTLTAAGPALRAGAAAEYTAVALLAALLTLTAAGTQQLATPTAKGEAKHPATA